MRRICEAYAGEYASGKSEVALNRALELLQGGDRVTLVDLDLDNPFYTLRPLAAALGARGLNVITLTADEALGLGERGGYLKPGAIASALLPGNLIYDLGHGAAGIKALDLLPFSPANYPFVLAVINAMRPATATIESIVRYIKTLGKVDALINNTHLGGETTPAIVEEGARKVAAAARLLGLRVAATTAASRLAPLIGPADGMGHPVRPLDLKMDKAYW